jgi:hypothetical protein
MLEGTHMVDHVEEPDTVGSLTDLIRHSLPVFQLIAVNARYVDDGDLVGVDGFVGLDLQSLAILELDHERIRGAGLGLGGDLGHGI